MPKDNRASAEFEKLSWDDLEEWAGEKIVNRGRNYQRNGYVSELVITEDGGLIAWVSGSERYITQVTIDEEGPQSVCTCPYYADCKHGVATVLEYLEQIKSKTPIPEMPADDPRQAFIDGEDWDDADDDAQLPSGKRKDIESLLKKKTKAQLIGLMMNFAGQYPDMADALCEEKLMQSGNVQKMIAKVRKDIEELSVEPGWQNYWKGEGYTPDYSKVGNKLEVILAAGFADEVLALGKELIVSGTQQVGESHDEGETEDEIANCLPVVVDALDQSSLAPLDRMKWAVEAILDDDYGLCDVFEDYLNRKHPKGLWQELADHLLGVMDRIKVNRRDRYTTDQYRRRRVRDYALEALKKAGNKDAMISLALSEAQKDGDYEDLVKILMAQKQYEQAKKWIKTGLADIGKSQGGTVRILREKLAEILGIEKNWPVLAAMRVESYVSDPGMIQYQNCKKACEKVKVWPKVRKFLLAFLEKGTLPWQQKQWPLPDTPLEAPKKPREKFPITGELIDIAIFEKKPDQVLKWYDTLPKGQFLGFRIDNNAVAEAIKSYAPDRAVAIWKYIAGHLIAQAKPKAYKDAARFLKKAAAVMKKNKKKNEWDLYIQSLRAEHKRKTRLIEVLDNLDGKPIAG